MKVGLITFHDTTNYGANLQAYALNRKINELGYFCETIDYQCDNIIKRELPHIVTNGTFRNFVGSLLRFPKFFIKHRKLYAFIKGNEKISVDRYTKKNIQDADDIYDKFIIGSDILWNLDINGNDYTYFLNFVTKGEKKYSYATSIGEPWSENEKRIVSPMLAEFKKIAVREEESMKWILDLTQKQVKLVCDPTMLLTSNEWSSFTKKLTNSKYVLIYLPNEKCERDAINYANQNNLKIVRLNYFDSIETFLSKIKFAECLFTGSYHGYVFSLYFHTNLMFYNFQDTARMRFLAKKFNLENHDATVLEKITDIPEIDWNNIDMVLEEFRNDSISYLKEILEQ